MSRLTLTMAIVAVMFMGCATIESLFEREKPIPLSQVPAAALKAAEAAVEGIVLTGAEVEEEDGRPVYEIQGHTKGMEYEIEVTADGRVIDIEKDEVDRCKYC